MEKLAGDVQFAEALYQHLYVAPQCLFTTKKIKFIWYVFDLFWHNLPH